MKYDTNFERRSFLKAAAAAALPLAARPATVFAVSVNAEPPVPVHLVGAGQDAFGEVRPSGFSTIQFKVPTQQTNGGLLIIEHSNLVKGGPPRHLHYEQEEWFYVLEGEVLFEVGEQRLQLKHGESVLAPRKIPHAFCAVGAQPARMVIAFTPAGKMEAFFRQLTQPHPPKQDAALYRSYGLEMVGPPLSAN